MSMRAVVVLIAGCVPLAALTVASFIGLGAIDDGVPTEEALAQFGELEEATRQEQALVRAESRASEQLAAAAFLAGEPVGALRQLPEQSSLAPVADTWARWFEARARVDELCRLVARAGTQEVEQLRTLRGELEKLGREHRHSTLPGRRLLFMVVDHQAQQLAERIRRLELRDEAYAEWEACQKAFAAAEYDQCLKLCDQLLAKYPDVLDPEDATRARLLRQRAGLWGQGRELAAALVSTPDPARRKTLLEEFLNRYADGPQWTPADRRVLQWCRAQLALATEAVAKRQRQLAAEEQTRRFLERLPATLPERFQRAAQIIERYPEAGIRQTLRRNAVAWLDEFFPAKAIEEHELLQEAEGQNGQIIRGFFKEHLGPDGQLIGYDYYQSYEQFVNPRSAVGTLRTGQLRRPPGTSVPRQCVTAYNEARAGLLKRLGEPEAWSEFATLCEELEQRLRQYRSRPGSSREPLAFAAEARRARELVSRGAVAALAALFAQ